MTHRLLNVVTVASLVLAALAAGLWLRSYWVNDFVFFRVAAAPPWGESWLVFSNRGRIKMGWQEDDVPTSPGLHYQRHEPTPWGEMRTFWQRLGFSRDAARNYRVQGFTIHYRSVVVPHWFVVGFLGVVPGGRVMRMAMRRRGGAVETPPSAGSPADSPVD